VNHSYAWNTLALSSLGVLAGYLIGSIPFGYLITYWKKGIDIRTVGSGNLGATNVGRELGFGYFLLVLFLDQLKGLLPTLTARLIVNQQPWSWPPDLSVLVALATILGHTFPVYLHFRGGKGVATSLGAVLALDPISCAAAVLAFGGLLGMTRYVSLSALGGGIAFVAARFARDEIPFSREHIAMSLFSIAVVVLLFVRHRGNLVRIWQGTERRVSFRRRGSSLGGQAHPSGKLVVPVMVGLAVLSVGLIGGTQIYRHANQPIEIKAGPWVLRETDRATTGQQRVERVAFARAGSRLAATCPRYDRLIVYPVEADGKLAPMREIELEGRPVALAMVDDKFVVLESPSGDQRHVEPGWWETFDADGNRQGGRNLAGYYPDDLAASADGKLLFVLSSGQAEGDGKKPPPGLEVVAVDSKTCSGRTLGRITFASTQDPCRLSLSASGKCAAILLAKTNETLAIDLTDPASPRLVGRTQPSGADAPYVSYSPDSDWIMMPVASQSEGIAIESPARGQELNARREIAPAHRVDYLVCTRHRDSVLELFQTEPRCSLGRLPLRGPLNLSRTRPTGLAYSRDRALLAVATRSGTIHLVKIEPRARAEPSLIGHVASGRADSY
jgi:glycerol-3-phosphate acyltransferase PlsY